MMVCDIEAYDFNSEDKWILWTQLDLTKLGIAREMHGCPLPRRHSNLCQLPEDGEHE